MTVLPIPKAPPPRNRKIRVLIVDDSHLIRTILTTMLEDLPDIQIVGQAGDGQEAVKLVMRLHPDVVTMDIRMPKVDGLEATRTIMQVRPTPIIVVANSVHTSDYNIAFNAIEAGALTVLEKPRGLGLQDYEAVREQLVSAIRLMSEVKVVGRHVSGARIDGIGPRTALLHTFFERPIKVVAIASSTGGPTILKHILTSLPADFTIPIVIVQHVIPAFVGGLAEWLNTGSPIRVSIAEEGSPLVPGTALLAPAERHMLIGSDGLVRLDPSPPINGLRPSATLLFESTAKVFKSNSVGIILTGMGDDGADGLEAMSKAGAHVVAQDESTSTIFSMPKTAIDRGVVDEILTPSEIVTRLLKLQKHMLSLTGRK